VVRHILSVGPPTIGRLVPPCSPGGIGLARQKLSEIVHVESPAATRIHLGRHVENRPSCRIECHQIVRSKDLRRFWLYECGSLNEEWHLEHAVVAQKADGVSRIIVATTAVWKHQSHGFRLSLREAARLKAVGPKTIEVGSGRDLDHADDNESNRRLPMNATGDGLSISIKHDALS